MTESYFYYKALDLAQELSDQLPLVKRLIEAIIRGDS